MRTPPPDLEDAEVQAAFAHSWGVNVQALAYLPLGFGSHHWFAATDDGTPYFLNVDDLDAKPWLGADRDATFAGLRNAFATARALREQAGLAFVVAPLPARNGSPLHRLTHRYSLAAVPFIAADPGHWGERLSAPDRQERLRLIGQLHLATPAIGSHAPHLGPEVQQRDGLAAALAALHQPWRGGPYAERARAELAAYADTVRSRLATFDALAARVAVQPRQPVITHGEPHSANFLTAGGRQVLIDWDTVALAPPERDLWMLDDGSPDGLAPYTEVTGRVVDPTAIALYRLGWALTDIAFCTATFRAPHLSTEDMATTWRSLSDTLRNEL